MKKNAQQANERDNQEFLNGLKKETAKEVVVKEVDSDLEDEGFAELSVA
jgi:hypothetical protein